MIDAPRNARSFVLNANGSFDYEPAAGFTGVDTFTYVAQDGETSSAKATVSIDGRRR